MEPDLRCDTTDGRGEAVVEQAEDVEAETTESGLVASPVRLEKVGRERGGRTARYEVGAANLGGG